MLECYAKAFLTEPPTVFGRRLLPFSLGHSFLLDAIGNPVAAGEPYSVQDAAVFAWICSMPFEEARAKLANAEAHKPELEAMGRESAGLDYQAECRKLEEYKADADTVPRKWSDGNEVNLRVPWQLAMFEILRGDSSLTPDLERSLWNMPQSRAACYAAARSAIRAGDDSVMSEEEVEALHVLKNLEAEEANA